MVVESVFRIPLADLKTIRVAIKGVTTELPLRVDRVRDSLQLQQRGGGISEAAAGAVLALVSVIAEAQQQISSDFGIEFVIADPDSQAIPAAKNQGGR
jgi:hypothetical protein